jgi:hypothetical protein
MKLANLCLSQLDAALSSQSLALTLEAEDVASTRQSLAVKAEFDQP